MTASIEVRLWNGDRVRMGSAADGVITVRDPFDKNHTLFYKGDPVLVKGVPDVTPQGRRDCAVIASSRGCTDGGFFPVKLNPEAPAGIDLLLPPKKPTFNFAEASWQQIATKSPALHNLLSTAPEAEERYERLAEDKKTHHHIACLLNIAAAIDTLPVGVQVMPMLKAIDFSTSGERTGLRSDRFFCWAEKTLIDVLHDHSTDIPNNPKAMFAQEKNPGAAHKGASLSYKETRFGEGNIQFTFHDNVTPPRSEWIRLELDMDYFQDAGAHAVLEFIPNVFAGSVLKLFGKTIKTNPATIYAMRWMAGMQLAGTNGTEKAFDPLYKLRPST